MVEQVEVLATKPEDPILISEPCDGKKELATQMVHWHYICAVAWAYAHTQ